MMKKRILAVLLTLILMVSLLPVGVLAANVTSGTCGENVTWSFDEASGTLTISGEGEMENYDPWSPTPWNEFKSDIKTAVVEQGVTRIGNSAFDQCTNLRYVTIPESVTTIGDFSFGSCVGLVEIKIPDSVTTIGAGAFGSSSLVSVTIPGSVSKMGYRSFAGCKLLETVIISDGVTVIGDSAFDYCTELESVIIPDSVTTIEYGAFMSCDSLQNVTIPDNITKIAEYAFFSSGLKEVTIPDGVTEICGSTFDTCTKLEKVTIPDGVTVIGHHAFRQCTELESVIIPDSVTAIEDGAFDECGALSEVNYGGTKEQWEAIEILDYNDALSKANIHYYCDHASTVVPGNAATCTKAGLTDGAKCSKCGKILSEQKEIPALGHNPELKNAKSATCIADGYTGDEICKNCGKTIKVGETIKAEGHKWDSGKIVKEPTEEAEGIKRYTCINCKETMDESIPVIEHKHNFADTTVKATCTEGGYILHACSCGESYKDNRTDALGHKYADGKCSVCSAADPNYVTPTPTPTPPENPFTDVADDAWYAAPVLWAKANNVTGGKTETTFGPDDGCTRAQVVTFLWAANGKPEPKSMNNPFKDVADNAWYLKPVLWAVEQGITGGVAEGKFGPEQTCTRAQIATFLYAAAGKPAVSGKSTFKDVKDADWFAKPIIWAAQNEVTGGIGDGKFGPNNTCTRAQVVTFLYKVYGNK